MAETDIESVVAAGTADDQKKHGTHNENFTKLADQFRELMVSGADDPEVYRRALRTLLKSFETVRVEQERYIRSYERKIEFCRARQLSSSEFSSVLIGILAGEVQAAKAAGGQLVPAEVTPNDQQPVRDVDVLGKVICMCGCQDEVDAADCECPCHTEQGYCEHVSCSYCAGKKASAESRPDETTGRRRPPAYKKAAKKKRTSKKATKKAT